MKIHKGDKVKIIAGKDIGREGNVERISTGKNKVVVSKVNVYKRHVKPSEKLREGGIVDIVKPISLSNVMLICSECQKPTRVGYKVVKGKKYRMCRKCMQVLSSEIKKVKAGSKK